ncbi:c-type cytochrome [Ferruginibacter sp. SUN106]|uniref:c-type cytochrome n=1 Tax=Ferruginibacter sp. SUN106 TaxID=2978348 RepID=UPI003D36300F
MKKIAIISTLILTTAVVFISCDSKREPGKVYMPDMAYSRAYETYAMRDSAKFSMEKADAGHKIYYTGQPVMGTVKRGELFPFPVTPNNTNGVIDSNALVNLSQTVKNPLPPLTKPDSLEAARLFNINCAVCHGAKAEANGPVAAKIGGVKSIVAASPGYSDGRIFYVMTYGQNNMGSYASQLDRKQRWMIVQYIRTLEPKAAAATPATEAPKADTTAAKKK